MTSYHAKTFRRAKLPSWYRRGGAKRRGGRSHTIGRKAIRSIVCERPPRPRLSVADTPPVPGGELFCLPTAGFLGLPHSLLFGLPTARFLACPHLLSCLPTACGLTYLRRLRLGSAISISNNSDRLVFSRTRAVRGLVMRRLALVTR